MDRRRRCLYAALYSCYRGTTHVFPFITGKNFAFRIVVEIITAAWLILALRDKAYRPGRSAVLTSISIFFVVVLFADILGVSPQTSFWSNFERMEGFITIAHLAAYAVVGGAMLNSTKLWDKFFYTSIGVSLFLSMYGYLQISGALAINQGGVRLDATLGNATYMGIYMLFNIFLLLMLFFRRTTNFSREILIPYFVGAVWFLLFLMQVGGSQRIDMSGKMYILGLVSLAVLCGAGYLWAHRKIMERLSVQYIISGVLLLIQTATLYYTATRGAILGLSAGLLLTAVLIAVFERRRKRLRKIALVGVVALFLCAGAFMLVKDSSFVKSSSVLSRFTNLSFREIGSRLMVWPMAIKGFKERPILGWGQNNFDVVFNKYYDPRMYSQEPWFDRTHDIFLDWAINAGAVGLMSYLSLYGATLYVLWKDRRKQFTLVDKALLTGMFAAYLINIAFVFDNIVSYLMFFSVIAYVHTIEARPREGGTWEFFSKQRSSVDWVIAPAASVALIVALYLINIKPIFASYNLIEAITPQEKGITQNLEKFKKVFAYDTIGVTEAREQLLQMTLQVIAADGVSNEVKEQFFKLTMEQFDQQFKETPLNARNYYFIGAFLRAINKPGDAVPFLERGLALSPKKQPILMELAAAHDALGEKDKALEFFKKAFELEKTNDIAAIYYAAAAEHQGKEDITKSVLEEKFGTILVPHSYLIRAYLAKGRTDLIVKMWEEIVAVNKESPGYKKAKISLGLAYYANGQVGNAIHEIEEAVAADASLKEQGDQLVGVMRKGGKIEDLESRLLLSDPTLRSNVGAR